MRTRSRDQRRRNEAALHQLGFVRLPGARGAASGGWGCSDDIAMATVEILAEYQAEVTELQVGAET